MTQQSTVLVHSFDNHKSDSTEINSEEILQLIPHRYPMLMIDRMEKVVLDQSAVGIKNVSINEWYFQGHFPEHPVLPGVLIIEAMAQTAGALVMKTLNLQGTGKLVYFMSVEEAKFRKPVLPGDVLELRVFKEKTEETSGNLGERLGLEVL